MQPAFSSIKAQIFYLYTASSDAETDSPAFWSAFEEAYPQLERDATFFLCRVYLLPGDETVNRSALATCFANGLEEPLQNTIAYSVAIGEADGTVTLLFPRKNIQLRKTGRKAAMKRVLAPLLNETANRLDCSYICYVGPKTMATQFTDTKIAIEHLLNSISVQPNTIVFISDSASFSEGSNNEPIQQKMMIDLIHAGKRDDFLRQVEANVNARLGDMFDIKTAYHMFVDYRQMFHVALFEYDIAASSAFSNPHLFTKMDVIHSKQAFLSAVTVQLDIVLSAIDAKRKAESLLGQIQSYVQEHLTSDLSREEIAQHFFVHPDYLSHFFHRNAGITLAAYIRKIRIQEAMRLLDATNLSISEISFQVGYSNPSYFTRAFFRELGITPREYRHRNDSPIAARK